MRFPLSRDKFAQRAAIFKKHKQPVGLIAQRERGRAAQTASDSKT